MIIQGTTVNGISVGSFVVPNAPVIGTATSVGATSATVTYTAPTFNGGTPVTSYVAVSSPGGVTGTDTTGSGTITVNGLTAGLSYTFVVYAVNMIGNSPNSSSSNSIATATVPGAPTSVVASPLSSTSASISFSPPSNNGNSLITSYTVTSSPGSFTASGSSSPITISGLTSGTAYTFTVTATNAVGTGPASSASSSLTMPGQTSFVYGSSIPEQGTTTNTTSYYYGFTTWVVPSGVTSISVVCIGSGATGAYRDTYEVPSGGGGGGLAYQNQVTVTPGETLYITYGPGQGGLNASSTTLNPMWASCSTLWRGTPFGSSSTLLCGATGGQRSYQTGSGSGVVGTAGYGGYAFVPGTGSSLSLQSGAGTTSTGGYGQGGMGVVGVYEATATHQIGGSGAGGYGGQGGRGGYYGTSSGTNATAGTYGAGGGGGYGTGGTSATGGAGGGTSPYGSSSSSGGSAGGNGSSGSDGGTYGSNDGSNPSAGGLYGGGGGSVQLATWTSNKYSMGGGQGIVRIVWPGTTRQFPSTNVSTDL